MRENSAINKIVCGEISSECNSLNSSSFILQNIEYSIPIYVIIHLSTHILNMSTHILTLSTQILNLSTQFFELSTQFRKWVLYFGDKYSTFGVEYSTFKLSTQLSAWIVIYQLNQKNHQLGWNHIWQKHNRKDKVVCWEISSGVLFFKTPLFSYLKILSTQYPYMSLFTLVLKFGIWVLIFGIWVLVFWSWVLNIWNWVLNLES